MILYRSDQSIIIIYMDQRDAPGNMQQYEHYVQYANRRFPSFVRRYWSVVRRILWRRNVYVYVYEYYLWR